jgi:hypothetical protein
LEPFIKSPWTALVSRIIPMSPRANSVYACSWFSLGVAPEFTMVWAFLTASTAGGWSKVSSERSSEITRVLARNGIPVGRTLAGCCGLAGNFGAEPGHETVSRQVAELELVPALEAADPDAPVLADGFSCRTQIAALSGRRARHLAEVLAVEPAGGVVLPGGVAHRLPDLARRHPRRERLVGRPAVEPRHHQVSGEAAGVGRAEHLLHH